MSVPRRSQNRNSRNTNIENPNQFLDEIDQKSKESVRRLEGLGFSTHTINGQRVSINTRVDAEPVLRSRWNEIFIGKLPRDLFEDELLPFISIPSLVYNIRYMLDFSHTNRGYCYVKYANTEEAARAINYLDGLTIVPGRPPIGAKISFDNRTLYFGNLPSSCSDKKLIDVLNKAEVSGIVSARMLVPPRNRSRQVLSLSGGQPSRFSGEPQMPMLGLGPVPSNSNNRSALVTFSTHEAATRARRLLLPGDVALFGRRIKLDWAKSEVPPQVQEILQRYQLYKQPTYQAIPAQAASVPQQMRYQRSRNESGQTSGSTDSSCASPNSTDFNNTTLMAHEVNMGPIQGLENNLCKNCFVEPPNLFNQDASAYFPNPFYGLNMDIAHANYKALQNLDFIENCHKFSNLLLNDFD